MSERGASSTPSRSVRPKRGREHWPRPPTGPLPGGSEPPAGEVTTGWEAGAYVTDLYHKHAVHARRAALAVPANGDDAADVVHTVFLRLFETLTDPPARPIGRRYIVTSARNRALNVLRARERLEQLDEAGTYADKELLPDRLVEQGEIRAALEEEIALLPRRCRAVAELRFLQGRSQSEIAAELI